MSMRYAPGPAGTATSRWRCWRMLILPSCARWRRRWRQAGETAGIDLAADLLPHTVPEVRRLLWRLIWQRPPDHDAALAWSHWRRRHQQRARRSHWKRRTTNETRL